MFNKKVFVVLLSLAGFIIFAYIAIYIYSGMYSAGSSSTLIEPSLEEEIAYLDDGKLADNVGTTTEEKVIKSASVEIEVEDLDDGIDSISVLGEVTYLSEVGKGNEKIVYMTIKVPSAEFEDVVNEVKALGLDVASVTLSSEDVTEAYIDLEARLKNEKAYESELLDVLASAKDVEDILAVRTELNQVRANIESMQAQLDYYNRNTEMSSISVTLSLFDTGIALNDTVWSPLGVARVALSSLVKALIGLADGLIWVVVFSPLFLAPYGIYRFVKRGKK